MKRQKIIFTIGSLNQTVQMHKIASFLDEYDCYFTQIFDNSLLVKVALKSGLLDRTIMGEELRRKTDSYLKANNLKNDFRLSVYNNEYTLAVLCSDMAVPAELRKTKTVWVQEGMTDMITSWAKLVKKLGLPAYLVGNTALNGSGNICDIYCAGSEGYKQRFSQIGTNEGKIIVTGIPNFDNAEEFLNNDFPYKKYVLVTTSDIRETYGKDDREKFISDCVHIANGRQLIFKLHPNEIFERAISEIQTFAPKGSIIYTDGNSNHMIANCDELITQYSSLAYIGIALNKKVYSYFDVEELKRLAPVQNGGTSAKNIADVCRGYIEYIGTGEDFLSDYSKNNELMIRA